MQSTHPEQVSTATGAAGTHIGRHALALAAALNKQHGLPMRKVCRVLEHFGLSITAGGLSQTLDRVADKLRPLYEQIGDVLRQSVAVHADETSSTGAGWPTWSSGWTRSGHPEEIRITNRLKKQRPQLRPAVIARKLSAGNKTDRGKCTFEILASLAATSRQQGKSFTEFVAAALSLGPPPPPPPFDPA